MARSVGATFNNIADQKKEMAELTNQVSNGPDSFFNSKTVASGGCGDGHCFLIPYVRDVSRMARSVAATFNYIADQEKEMAELTNRVSNGPDSFFNSKTVATGGRGNGHCFLVPCGRDVGQNGKVSGSDFQLHC
jgi:RecA/RadA recombinase